MYFVSSKTPSSGNLSSSLFVFFFPFCCSPLVEAVAAKTPPTRSLIQSFDRNNTATALS